MANKFNTEIEVQNSIYGTTPTEHNRKLKIEFSIPSKGITENTGVLLLASGFLGNTEAKVFKKMRQTFADTYDFVTVQCDYFGCEFIQNEFEWGKYTLPDNFEKAYSEAERELILRNGFNAYAYLNIKPRETVELTVEGLLNETPENFSDFSLIQATDNISAVLTVISHVVSKYGVLNTNRIGIYGNSQGGYLGYVCNRLCPSLFKFHVDNCAWVYPQFLRGSRILNKANGDAKLSVELIYLAKSIIEDKDILYLSELYKGFKNDCKVICYHGESDHLVSIEDKSNLISKLGGQFNLITEKDIDGDMIKSTGHCLVADYLKLFDDAYSRLEFDSPDLSFNLKERVVIKSSKYTYNFDYSNLLPHITRTPKASVRSKNKIKSKRLKLV